MKASYTKFGKTAFVPLVTFTNGKQDALPKSTWDKTLWVERGEDEYALLNPEFARGTVRIVERQAWLKALAEKVDKATFCRHGYRIGLSCPICKGSPQISETEAVVTAHDD